MADQTTSATGSTPLGEDAVVAICHGMWLVARLTELRSRAGLPPLDMDTPFLVPMPAGIDGALFETHGLRGTFGNLHGGVSLDLPRDDGSELGRVRVGEPHVPAKARRYVMRDACHRTGDLLLEASAILLRDGLISDDTHQYNREAAYRAIEPFACGATLVMQDPTAAVVRGTSDAAA